MKLSQRLNVAKNIITPMLGTNQTIPVQTDQGIFGGRLSIVKEFNPVLKVNEDRLRVSVGDWKSGLISWNTALDAVTGDIPSVILGLN